jgi:hypothetical protein
MKAVRDTMLLALLLTSLPAVWAGQFAKVQAVKAFADTFLDPVRVVNTRGVGVFAEDVVGKIDVLTTYVVIRLLASD